MREVLCPVVVGRALEVHVLESALEGVLAGRGGCVAISGEAGIGKSRLIRELARLAADRQVTVVKGRALSAAATTPFRPLTEVLLQLLRGAPLPDDPSLEPWLAHLGAVLPTAAAKRGPADPVGDSGADVIRGEAVLRLLRHLSPEGLVVTVEDMHWADPDTVALLEYLTDHASGHPLLFVIALRSEPPSPATELVHRQRGRPGVVHLHLERLSEREVADMITACRFDADYVARARIVRVSEGIPLLVEELLASPGIPESITETVRVRLAELTDDERMVLEAAAVIGRYFDWEILPAASHQDWEVVSRSLARAVERVLVSADGTGFRFRHALTREAVLASMLPLRVRETARHALAAIDSAHPYLEGYWRDVAADLAVRAGDRARAGRLLADAGLSSVRVGALATAADTLRRAVEFLTDERERTAAEIALLQALALAGRVDEAAVAATGLIRRLSDDPTTVETRFEAHVRLAHASVAASRWPLARHHISAALDLVGETTAPGLSARAAVLSADVALAEGDVAGARRAAEEVLVVTAAGPEVHCHAHEIVGRSHRLHDLVAATQAFEAALAIAEQHDLPVWRMRALHELGTVEMFERAEVSRLTQARQLGEQMGALSTVAVLDLQLAAAFTVRWDLETCDAHACSALDVGRQMGLDQVTAKALALMAGSASMRADREATERWGSQAMAAYPADPMLGGFCRASVGMALLMAGDSDAAVGPFAEGTASLSRVPNAEPISIRALWPLIQAAQGDKRAAATIDEVRRLGVDGLHLNRGLIGFAQAVLEGRAGRPGRADAIVAGLASSFVNCETWADLARFIAAPALSPTGGATRGAGSEPPTTASPIWTSTASPSGAQTCFATCPRTLGPRKGSPTAKRMSSAWSSTAWRTNRSRPPWDCPRVRWRNTSRACCARQGPGRGPSWPPPSAGPLRRPPASSTWSHRCVRPAGGASFYRGLAPGGTQGGQTMLESKNIATPDDKHSFEHGEVSLVKLTGFTIGRAEFRPGWRWSSDVKPIVGTDSCRGTHMSYVVSGRFHVIMDDGRELELGPGDAHLVGPGHDAWVVGDEPCVTIDFIPTGDTAGTGMP